MPAVQNEETPIITGGKSSNKFVKIALIVLGIVLLVIISEAAYYLYSKGSLGQTQESKDAPSVSQPSPTPTVLFKKSINIEKIKTFAASFESLKPKESFYDKATVNTSITGEVVITSPEKTEIRGIKIVYTIVLKNAIDQTLTYGFTQNEVADAYVILVGSATQEEIGIEQIQVGDIVNVIETIDLLDEGPDSRLILEVRR